MKKINIIEALNIADLPEDNQERIEKSVKRLLQRRIMLRLMKELGVDESKKMLEFVKAKGMSEMNSYVETKLPTYSEIVYNEILTVLGRLQALNKPLSGFSRI